MPLFESYSPPITSFNSSDLATYNNFITSGSNSSNEITEIDNLFKTSMNHSAFDSFLLEEGLQSPLDSSRTLFVGDLSYFCTEEDLYALFSPLGHILTVRVRRGVTGESLMHGFVAMDTSEASRTAIDTLDGKEFMGRIIRVQLSSDGQRNPFNKEALVQVHVSFISKQTVYLVTEKVLREIFTSFGNIVDVAIKKHASIPRQNRQSGYGFVYFHDVASAYRAQQTLKNSTIHDITLDCSISHKSESMIRQTRGISGGIPPMMLHSNSYVSSKGSAGGVAASRNVNNKSFPQSNLPPHVLCAMAAAAPANQRDQPQQYPSYHPNPRMMQQPQFLGEEQRFSGAATGHGRIGGLDQQQQQAMPYHRAALASNSLYHRSVGQQFSNPYQQEEANYAAMQQQRPRAASHGYSMDPIVPTLSLVGGSSQRNTSALMMSFHNSGTSTLTQQQQLSSSPRAMQQLPTIHAQNSPLHLSHGGSNYNHSTSSEFFSEEGKTTLGNTGSSSGPNTVRNGGGVFSGLGLNVNSSYSFAFSDSQQFIRGTDSFSSISPREPTARELALPMSTLGSGSLLGLTSSSSGAEPVRCVQCGRHEMLLEPLEATLAAHHRCNNCLNGYISDADAAWR